MRASLLHRSGAAAQRCAGVRPSQPAVAAPSAASAPSSAAAAAAASSVPRAPLAAAPAPARRGCVTARAESKPVGFGKKPKSQAPKPKAPTGAPGAFEKGSAEFKDGWRGVGSVEELFGSGKATRAAEVNQTQLCVYKFGDRVFASDALSTAFKYPLIDASVLEVGGRPVAETPLDGTQYDLETGAVVAWCPGGGVVRGLLSNLKKNDTPVPLKMYPVQVVGGSVYVKLYNAI